MRTFTLLLALLALGGAAAADEVDTCVSCHTDQDDEDLAQPVAAMQKDIHARQGLACADCHGGDPTSDDEDVAMDWDADFRGAPDRDEIPGFCGRCHSDATFIRQYNPSLRVDQEALYATSVHGQRLAQGDDKVAVCTDCHQAHGILPANDPRSPIYAANVPATCGRCHGDAEYMAAYGIPTDQLARYRTSVHGQALLDKGDLSAPACNDCHGNHGATPPGVKSLANVCGQCHPLNSELVAASPHKKAFERLGIAACTTCHSHHDIATPGDRMLGATPEAVCARCHSPEQRSQTVAAAKGHVTAAGLAKGWDAAARMRAAVDSLRGLHGEARNLILRAEQSGMEVSDALYDLREAKARLTRARSLVHTFDPARVGKVVDEGLELAQGARDDGDKALDDLAYRRSGLALSLLVIGVVAVALVFRIRALEPPGRDREPHETTEDGRS